MRKFYLVANVLLLFSVNLVAQSSRNCGTMPYLTAQLAADPGLAGRMSQIEQEIQAWNSGSGIERTQAIITIPVVFHVVYNTTSQNISDTKILEQLDVLNKDFARLNTDAGNTPGVFQGVSSNTNVQFCMAQSDPNGNATNGIVRVQTSATSFSSNDNVKFTSSGGSNAWPAGSYMNVWVCNLGGGLLGYAQFPGSSASTDGVVVLYSSVGGPSAPGTAVPYHLGRTATHEVGHWLNLRHIWGDANCGNDQVTDTPTQQTSNYGCPSFPHTTCSNGANGDMFMNYMDYTDDACMNMFTTGQGSRMTATLNGTRSSLLTSMGCTPPSGGGTCGTPASLSSGSITSSSASLNWSAVAGATGYNVQYKISTSANWTVVSTTNTSTTLTGLTAATSYLFQVQAVCGALTGAYSGSASFTTLAASTCSDIYEANNTSSTSKPISVNSDIDALISTSADVDWFIFNTTAPNTNFQLILSNLPADYDVQLYRSNLRKLSTSQNSGIATEVINRNSSTASTYYARVYGYNGASNNSQCYKLRINTSSAPFRVEDNMSNVSKADLVNGIFAVPNPSSTRTTFEFLSEIPGPATFYVVDMMGKIIVEGNHEVTEGLNQMEIKVSNFRNGLYFILIDQVGDRRKGRFVVLQ